MSTRGSQGTEGRTFFFSIGANETAELDYWLRRGHDEASPREPELADDVLDGAGGLGFEVWQSRDAMAGMDAVAVVTRDREPDEAAFLAKLRRNFDDVELAEEIDVRSHGVFVQRATIWTCRNYRPPLPEATALEVPGGGGSDLIRAIQETRSTP